MSDRSLPHEIRRLSARLAALAESDLVGPFPNLTTTWMPPGGQHYSPEELVSELEYALSRVEESLITREMVDLDALLAYAANDAKEAGFEMDPELANYVPKDVQDYLEDLGIDAHLDTEGRWWSSIRQLWRRPRVAVSALIYVDRSDPADVGWAWSVRFSDRHEESGSAESAEDAVRQARQHAPTAPETLGGVDLGQWVYHDGDDGSYAWTGRVSS